MNFTWLVFCLLLITTNGFTQTCCTGGVPHLAGLRIPQVNKKQIGVSLSYIYNRNGDLILDNSAVETSAIYRNVNSILLQGDYGVDDYFSFSFIFPYIIQSEVIDFDNNKQTYYNTGIGDISFWGSYKVDVSSKLFLTTSMGVKFPTGTTDERDGDSAIPLPFSFQNGTGSFDFGLITFTKYSIDKSKLYNIISQIAVKLNTRGNQFEAHSNYLFGHSAQVGLLFNHSFIIAKGILDMNIGANYQYRVKDQFDSGFQNENTGGQWLNAIAGLSMAFNPKLLVSFNGLLPVLRDVNGLQLSTTWMGNLGVSYVIN